MEAKRPKRKSNDWEGIVHEFTFSTFRRQPFFLDYEFRQIFLDKLGEARKRHGFLVWAYVIMPEHVHLLIPPHGVPVALILRSIKQATSQTIISQLLKDNPSRLLQMQSGRIRGNSPYSFWQSGGGYDRDIDNSKEAWGAIEYIHLNPVRRGLVEKKRTGRGLRPETTCKCRRLSSKPIFVRSGRGERYLTGGVIRLAPTQRM